MIPDAFIIDLEIRIELNKKKNRNSKKFYCPWTSET